MQTGGSAWWKEALVGGITTAIAVGLGYLVARWQVGAQGRQVGQAGELSDRQRAYLNFVAAVDLAYNRAHLIRTNLELSTSGDNLARMLGTKPPRDQLDYDAAMSPTIERFVVAGVAMRVHGSDAAWEAAIKLTDALQAVNDAATAGAKELTWIWGYWKRAIRRWLRMPAPWAKDQEDAETAYFSARKTFESVMRAEWRAPVIYRKPLELQPAGRPSTTADAPPGAKTNLENQKSA